jgi:hypothetical protein
MKNLRAQWLGKDVAVLISQDRFGREWYSVVTSRHDVKIAISVGNENGKFDELSSMFAPGDPQ